MTYVSFYFFLEKINFVDREMSNFLALLTDEMTVIVFFGRINHFSVADIGMECLLFSQLLQESIHRGDTDGAIFFLYVFVQLVCCEEGGKR